MKLPKGSVMVLAMIFIALFGVLAIALMSMVNVSVATVHDQRAVVRAQGAAESGLEYMKNVLSPLESSNNKKLYSDLTAALAGPIEALPDVNKPAKVKVGPMTVDAIAGTTFTAYVSLDKTVNPRCFQVDVVGNEGAEIHRTVSSRFVAGLPFQIPAGGVTNGEASLWGNANIVNYQDSYRFPDGNGGTFDGARLLSTLPADVVPSIVIRGNVSMDGNAWPSDPAQVSTSGNVHFGGITIEDPPDFPMFEPTAFRRFATGTYVKDKRIPCTNVLIPANSNLKIEGNGTLEGIIYIESPNNVQITGNVTLNCVIVFADKHNDGTPSKPGENLLTVEGNITMGPVPARLGEVATATAAYGILAPAADVVIRGNVNALYGSVVANKLEMFGNVDVTIENGSLLSYSTAADAMNIHGNGNIIFKKTPAYRDPNFGLVRRKVKLVPGTYTEVIPQ